MLKKIKNRIEKKLVIFAADIEKNYGLNGISPFLFKNIKNFLLRNGKRIRPILFVIGYLGFSKKRAGGLYTSALSMELLHDFMLVHDDIIDKSDTRRGKPSMHKQLNNYLSKYKNAKFNGQDLSIVVGDVMYAMGLDAFLEIKENKGRKEEALKQLIKAALYTGSGEFIELLYGIKEISKLKKQDIYKIYDYKTAYYTFASPLSIGAILAGAGQNEVKKLIQYGIFLGRAFQIKDDLQGIFSEESEIGKSNLTDLREAKKTILIWYAYTHSNKKDKSDITKILTKNKTNRNDLLKMRRIIFSSGALDYAKQEILNSTAAAQKSIGSSRIKARYKSYLNEYSREILKI